MNEPDTDELREIYAAAAATIAVVGASADEDKPSHRIPRYMQEQGYRIIPVNPRGGQILGEEVLSSLDELGAPPDIVNVFRPSREAPAIARAAAAAGARVLWLQEGIASDEAASIAAGAGMKIVMDRCIGATHGELGLGPGP